MYQILYFFTYLVGRFVSILDTKLFSDFPLTYLQLFLGCIAIKFVFKFLFGGFKEVDTSANFITPKIATKISSMSNSTRKQQIVDIKNNSGKLEADILKEAYRR